MDTLSEGFLVQKRVRNISGLAIRHLDVISLDLQCPFTMGFTLAVGEEDSPDVFFTSDVIENSANPRWEEISLDMESPTKLNTYHCLLTVFAVSGSVPVRRLLHWTLDLRSLVLIGPDLDNVEVDFRPNTVVFLLKSGVYLCPEDIPSAFVQPVPPPSRSLRKLYSSAKLRQLMKLEKDLAQVQERRRNGRNACRDSAVSVVSRSVAQRQIELLGLRIRNFRTTLSELQRSNQALLHSNTDLRLRNESISSALSSNQADLYGAKADAGNRHSEMVSSRNALKRKKEDLRYRQRELISSIRFVYPIHRSPSGRTFITGIWLPAVDQHVNCDDMTLSAGLGYAVHLSILLSKILDVPLRYPLKFFCSMSSITDPISPKLTDREREYPVYIKARDRTKYHYGVFFLNLDIAQLRWHFGLGTPDLKKTLENMQNLMEEKFALAPRASLAVVEPVSGFSPMGGPSSLEASENGTPSLHTVQSTPDFRRSKNLTSATSAVFIPIGNGTDSGSKKRTD